MVWREGKEKHLSNVELSVTLEKKVLFSYWQGRPFGPAQTIVMFHLKAVSANKRILWIPLQRPHDWSPHTPLHSSLISVHKGSTHFFYKGLCKHFGLCEPYRLCHNCKLCQGGESRFRQHGNDFVKKKKKKKTWSVTKNFELYIIFTCHKVLFFFWYVPNISKGFLVAQMVKNLLEV